MTHETQQDDLEFTPAAAWLGVVAYVLLAALLVAVFL